jgi:uncharacterized protein with PQ loop repeat
MFGYEISDIAVLAALVITVVYTVLGLPMQILRNYKTKSAAGLSLFLMIIPTVSFVIWAAYGFVKAPVGWYLFIANLPGVLFGSRILFKCLFIEIIGNLVESEVINE